MPSSNVMNIIVQAQDMASSVAQKVDNSFRKLGRTIDDTFSTSLSNTKFNQELTSFGTDLDRVREKLKSVGVNGQSSFNQLTSAERRTLEKLSELDPVSASVLQKLSRIGISGQQTFNQLSSSEQRALVNMKSTAEQLEEVNSKLRVVGIGAAQASNMLNMMKLDPSIGSNLDRAKLKVSEMGYSLDSTKGKILVLGTAIQSSLVNKWDTIKTKVHTTATNIKTLLGNALNTVKSKVQNLGNAFSGLGGIISSAIGAIGMASISQMTIGLAMNRERMTALTNATMGSAKAGDQLLNGFVGVNKVFKDIHGNATNAFMGLDEMTNHSLVSLDDLGQAMSTIKMSTGMTNEQLMMFSSTVNDIGQRAILMGKSGDEAIGLMQAAGRGLNGEFEVLKSNFGITKDMLVDLGWSGAASDVEGYQKALDKALEKGGDMDGMLDTTTGHLETLKKNFRVAGRHVGEMFTPYIDMAVQKLNSLKETCPGLFENLVMIAGAVSGFATVAPSIAPMISVFGDVGSAIKKTAGFLGLMEVAEDAVTLKSTFLTIAEIAGADAAVLQTAANSGLTASFWAMASAILANPLTWVAVALIAIAVAVYEVGKSFGWWSDIGSMIGAIWAGIQRLWSAFINNPNVQGFLKDLSKAWDDLCIALAPVIDWAKKAWKELFPSSATGSFDIVRAIIDVFGQLGDFLGKVVNAFKRAWTTIGGFAGFLPVLLGPIGIVVFALRSIVCILLGCSPGIVPALQKTQQVFSSVFGAIAGFIGGAVSNIVSILTRIISALTNIFTRVSSVVSSYLTRVINSVISWATSIVSNAKNASSKFLATVVNHFGKLPVKVWNYLKNIIQKVTSWASTIVSKGKTAASKFLTAVVNHFSKLPSKVGTYISNTASRISSGANKWVSNARSKASSTVSAVTGQVSKLPGKVYSEFMGIGSRMLSAGSSLVSKARQIGSNIVKGLLDAMKIHSPGEIQQKVVAEFENTLSRVGSMDSTALGVGRSVGSSMVTGFSDFGLETGGFNADYSTDYTLSRESNEKIDVSIKQELDFVFDFKNLPDDVSEEKVMEMLKQMVTDKSVIQALVTNSDFQNLDAKVKNSILTKVRRARGV